MDAKVLQQKSGHLVFGESQNTPSESPETVVQS